MRPGGCAGGVVNTPQLLSASNARAAALVQQCRCGCADAARRQQCTPLAGIAQGAYLMNSVAVGYTPSRGAGASNASAQRPRTQATLHQALIATHPQLTPLAVPAWAEGHVAALDLQRKEPGIGSERASVNSERLCE